MVVEENREGVTWLGKRKEKVQLGWGRELRGRNLVVEENREGVTWLGKRIERA